MFYLWVKILQVPTTFKNVQKGLNKSALAYELKPVFSQAWEKGLGDSQSADFDTISNKQFSPNLTTQWVKKCYSLLFSKYEIHKGWYLTICTGYIIKVDTHRYMRV